MLFTHLEWNNGSLVYQYIHLGNMALVIMFHGIYSFIGWVFEVEFAICVLLRIPAAIFLNAKACREKSSL